MPKPIMRLLSKIKNAQHNLSGVYLRLFVAEDYFLVAGFLVVFFLSLVAGFLSGMV